LGWNSRSYAPNYKGGYKLEVLWLINKAQVDLHFEKETLQKTVEMLDLKELANIPKYLKYFNKDLFTIGEVLFSLLTHRQSLFECAQKFILIPVVPPQAYACGFLFGPQE